MSPWLVMPTGAAATRDAALLDLRTTLAGARCAVRLLQRHLDDPAERELAIAVEREVERALAAARRLA
jgi:hypothetical protein